MRSVVVYESIYGNTHAVAEHIGVGLHAAGEVHVVSVSAATSELLAAADLVVVGGPTHVHGMTSATSRHNAVESAARGELNVDAAATDPGLRDWFDQLEAVHGKVAAAFDTRFDGPPLLTGRASRGIARHLRGLGYRVLLAPESFLVDKHNVLIPGEAERATQWAADLLGAIPIGAAAS